MSIGTYRQPEQVRGCPEGWMSKTDSSILPSISYKGVEIVSPVLQGLDGIKQIEQTTNKLQALGAVSNASCGFHVHVGLPQKCYQNGVRNKEATRQFVRNLVSWTGRYELALYASTGNITRVGNIFCKSVQEKYALDQLWDKNGVMYLENNFREHNERYNVLNVINLFDSYRPDTIEFRVFAGTVELIKMIANIQIALGMVRKAQSNGFRTFNKKSNENRKTGVGRTQVDIMMETFHWNTTTPVIGLGWISPTEYHDNVVNHLRQSADDFDKQVYNHPGGSEILRKWYKELN